MTNKILETIVEPSKIIVGSTFLIKVKVDLIESYQLLTEKGDNLIMETGENIITEGDFFNEQKS